MHDDASHAAPPSHPTPWYPTMANKEMDSETGLELASARQTVRLFGRALTLRCPNCGKGPVLKHWLKLQVRCGSCGIRLERGEHDYFMGSLMLNFVIAGVLLLATLAVVLVAASPDVPWDALETWGPVAMVIAPFVIFPFSKLLWLAFDLMLRPVTAEELEWHRGAATAWSTERAPRGNG